MSKTGKGEQHPQEMKKPGRSHRKQQAHSQTGKPHQTSPLGTTHRISPPHLDKTFKFKPKRTDKEHKQPYCTQILGDLGAEVIKIEHPTRGDDTRAWGPPYAKHIKGTEAQKSAPGESAYFLSVNRNKKSLALSFQSPEGVKILHKLAEECDVLVENYLPGALAKYGMDYKTLSKVNPKLIYASITGYGQTGPYSNRAGYDVMVEA